MDDASYEAGYRAGGSGLIADIALRFYDGDTMGDLLESFRVLTGDPELAWPDADVDWRGVFRKYAESVKVQEGYYFLDEHVFTPEEWAAITRLPGMERPA